MISCVWNAYKSSFGSYMSIQWDIHTVMKLCSNSYLQSQMVLSYIYIFLTNEPYYCFHGTNEMVYMNWVSSIISPFRIININMELFAPFWPVSSMGKPSSAVGDLGVPASSFLLFPGPDSPRTTTINNNWILQEHWRIRHSPWLIIIH